MLAQNFKTAADLDLSDAEWTALVKVLGMLEREEIPENLFIMSWVGAPECGTPGCILGWARYQARPARVFANIHYYPHPLYRLFFPVVGMSAKRAQAAVALRNYLTMGRSNWEEAMAT